MYIECENGEIKEEESIAGEIKRGNLGLIFVHAYRRIVWEWERKLERKNLR